MMIQRCFGGPEIGKSAARPRTHLAYKLCSAPRFLGVQSRELIIIAFNSRELGRSWRAPEADPVGFVGISSPRWLLC